MLKGNCLLGVNVDHVATIRQARGVHYPDPLEAALEAERAGADGITVHLREDRRHIQDHDVVRLKQNISTRLNLEMAVTQPMIDFALEVVPAYVCFVPEKRQELTTEGGLDVINQREKINDAIQQLSEKDIQVSLFIDPDIAQVEMAQKVKAPFIELHTGCYADAVDDDERTHELNRIKEAVVRARQLGLSVNAGHGLTLENVSPIASITDVYELNIGHSIVADALIKGFYNAVKAMKEVLGEPRP